MAGQGAAQGALTGASVGFAMSAVGGAVGQVVGRRLATMAISRGLSATPVPGLGSAIGGVMAVAGLAARDWGATGDTVGRIGTGSGYERLANDLEGVAEILDVAMSIMDVIAGVLGGVAAGMWVAAVLSAGTLSPLAAALSGVAIAINIGTTAVGVLLSAVVRPVVAALRALHTFESQGDPARIEQEGMLLAAAAGQVTGAAAGVLAAKAGGRVGQAGGTRIDRGVGRLQQQATGGAPSVSAHTEGGPRLHVEVPEGPDHKTGTAANAPVPELSPGLDTAIGGDSVGPHSPRPLSPASGDEDWGDFGALVRQLNEDPNVADKLTDKRPTLARRDVPWGPGKARLYANRQAAKFRAETEMAGEEVQAGHTAAARHARESGISETDWDSQKMMPLHSRRDPNLAVTVTEEGKTKTRTRHTAQEGMINDAVDRVRTAQGELTPRGQLDAADEVHWRLGNTPYDQRDIEGLRRQGRASPEPGPLVDAATGLVNVPDAPGPMAPSTGKSASLDPSGPPPTSSAAPRPIASRSEAMALYHAQIQADPQRESGVWRDTEGSYYVQQGDEKTVAPPVVAGPLELIYHSHPTQSDPSMRGFMSQPSQAGGDFGVLQYQHGQGAAGRRQSSELHFPVYDDSGSHVGYGVTTFVYEPTHPLPLQVSTTLPGGRTTRQRYRSFTAYQTRTNVGAGGTTHEARESALRTAEDQLSTDQESVQAQIGDRTRDLPPDLATVGVREGRQEGREDIERTGALAATPRGPAYTAAVSGLRPGESFEIPVNPAYPPPPGTVREIALLQARIGLMREAKRELGGTDRQMQDQEQRQQRQDAQLTRAGAIGQQLGAGTAAHVAATSSTRSTNTQQQATAGEADSALGRTAQQAAATATLVGSLRVFQGMAYLFGYLPGDLGKQAGRAHRDADRLISALNRVREVDSVKGSVAQQREGITANTARIDGVMRGNEQTAAEVARGQQHVAQLGERNQERLAETQATREQAQREGQEAEQDQEESQAVREELLARMRAWAAEHSAARQRAVEEAREHLLAQGLRAEEVR